MYINMPLESYQQLRTMGVLFTEKGNIYQIFTSRDSKVHIQAEITHFNLLQDFQCELRGHDGYRWIYVDWRALPHF